MRQATHRSRIERQAAVIEAGANVIRSSQLDWSSGLTYDVLETNSGVDRAQITRDFGNKTNLVDEVIKHSIEIDEAELDRYLEELEEILGDRTISLAEALAAAGDLDDSFVRDSRRLYAQMTLMGTASDEEDVAHLIRNCYRNFDEQRLEIISRTFEKRVGEAGLKMREGLHSAEIMALFTAIAEGLAVRSAIDPGTMRPGSTGIVYQLIIEGLVELPPIACNGKPGHIGDRLLASGL